jgi:hypothetical protein
LPIDTLLCLPRQFQPAAKTMRRRALVSWRPPIHNRYGCQQAPSRGGGEFRRRPRAFQSRIPLGNATQKGSLAKNVPPMARADRPSDQKEAFDNFCWSEWSLGTNVFHIFHMLPFLKCDCKKTHCATTWARGTRCKAG